jgi:hypothetical protein
MYKKMSYRIQKPRPVVVPASPEPLPGGAQNSQVLMNIGGRNAWTYPQYWIQGKNFIPSRTLDVSSIQQFELSATGKYAGAALSNRGFIYCMPDNCDNVMIINPYTNQIDNTTISRINKATYPVLASTEYLYAGGVTYNNNIYGIPQAARAVMNINTNTNTVSFIDISNLTDASYNWFGGVLAPNGIIYGMNHENTRILRIDPSSNTVSKIDISGLAGSSPYYIGGVLAPNGNIYGVPFRASSVVVVNPVTNTALANIPGLTGLGSGGDKWAGGVLAPNGRIYCIPFSSSNVLVIDPSTNTTSTIATGSAETNKWLGGVLALDGNIYGVPLRSPSVLIIDPSRNTVNTTDISGFYTVNDRWTGGVLAPNGKIYTVMSRSPNVGIIKTNLPTIEPWMTAPEFNKL